MKFAYSAKDALGKVIDGTIDSENREAAIQMLRRDGFQVLKIDEDDDNAGLFPKRIKRTDIIYFTSQLAIMVDTGITSPQLHA